MQTRLLLFARLIGSNWSHGQSQGARRRRDLGLRSLTPSAYKCLLFLNRRISATDQKPIQIFRLGGGTEIFAVFRGMALSLENRNQLRSSTI